MPEISYLVNLLQIWIRPGARFTPSSLDFQGPMRAQRTQPELQRFPEHGPLPQGEPIPWHPTLDKEKRSLPWASTYLRHSRFRNLTSTPFQLAGGNVGHCPTLLNAVHPFLSSNWPMFSCYSHGTFSTSCLNKPKIVQNKDRGICLFAHSVTLTPPLSVAISLSSAACSTSGDWPLVTHVVYYITSLQHLHISLIERGASVFLTVLKVVSSGFLNTLPHCNTMIMPKPNES